MVLTRAHSYQGVAFWLQGLINLPLMLCNVSQHQISAKIELKTVYSMSTICKKKLQICVCRYMSVFVCGFIGVYL